MIRIVHEHSTVMSKHHNSNSDDDTDADADADADDNDDNDDNDNNSNHNNPEQPCGHLPVPFVISIPSHHLKWTRIHSCRKAMVLKAMVAVVAVVVVVVVVVFFVVVALIGGLFLGLAFH
ncbi:unnamed protein product [Polarella glacialis]|uniref:Uncharacterized protein n=1 Tax=Polarella glacialis TaxID=89957 RepID=A0A813HC55_POLGL|nr:unnamed protein product [Polarella glacialis]